MQPNAVFTGAEPSTDSGPQWSTVGRQSEADRRALASAHAR